MDAASWRPCFQLPLCRSHGLISTGFNGSFQKSLKVLTQPQSRSSNKIFSSTHGSTNYGPTTNPAPTRFLNKVFSEYSHALIYILSLATYTSPGRAEQLQQSVWPRKWKICTHLAFYRISLPTPLLNHYSINFYLLLLYENYRHIVEKT